MANEKGYKIVRGDTLMEINKKVVQQFGDIRGLYGKNCQLEPDAINVVEYHVAMDHAVRCKMLLCLKGGFGKPPVHDWIDMPYDDFNELLEMTVSVAKSS